MPGCSKKKAETLIENRPYDNWENLVSTSRSCLGHILHLHACESTCDKDGVGRLWCDFPQAAPTWPDFTTIMYVRHM